MQKVTHYISSLIFLIAFCFVYQVVAEKWLMPPEVSTVAINEKSRVGNNESIVDLFPPGSWQVGECKRLQTDDGILLFQYWEQTQEDEWKLWPVSLVVGRGMSGELDPEPVIMDAAEGAELKFTETFDIFSRNAPPIERGRLIGKVHIHRTSVDTSDSLSITTSNVGINNRKIWTTEAIRMNVGKAQLVGRDLTLFLAASATANASSGNLTSVLDRMELTYLDELTLPLEQGPLWEPQKTASDKPVRLPSTRSASPMPAMINIKCGGRVDYDFQLDQLSLRDTISLIHYVPGGLQDHFDCDALDLHLRNPYDKTIERNSPIDWISRITATGSPASASMPSFDVNIKAERIDFDAVAGLVTAGGKGGVEVGRGGVNARLSKLAYQYDPKHPKSVGAIDAIGAGIVGFTDPKSMVRELRWKDGIKVRGSHVSGVKIDESPLEFWVDGDVEALFVDGGSFQAKAVEGVLKPKSVPKSPLVATAKKTKKESSLPSLIPDRMQASGDVKIDTTAIAVETDVLRLYFVEPVDPEAEFVQPSSNNSATSSPLQQWVSQPESKDGLVKPVSKQRPLVRGDLVSAQLHLFKKGPVAKDLSVTGNVQVEHIVNAGGTLLPAKLMGEELRLNNETGKELLQLGSGPQAPARLEIGDGFFVGPKILIWPGENFVQIRGAGEFQLPREILPTALTSDDPTRFTWNRPPHCQWKGEARFNGAEAHLTEGVQISAELVDRGEPWHIRMQGEQLQIVMTDEVKVDQIQSIKRAAIKQITMHHSAENPVLVTAERGSTDGLLEARHMLHAPQLSLMPSEGGKLVGLGPGWYRSWFYAPKDGLLFSKPDETDAPTGRQPSKDRLNGMHLTFHETMEADLDRKSLSFNRGVRVGVKTLSDWRSSFDAHEMEDLALNESTLDCDRLSVAMSPTFANDARRIPGLPTPWEMTAEDGVFFRTATEDGLLEGTAARATYASGKEVFSIEGEANRAARVRRTNPNGEPGFIGDFRRFSINPKTFEKIHAELIGFGSSLPPQQNQ